MPQRGPVQCRRVDSHTIAIIGGGNMGRALIGGLLQRGARSADIRVGEASAAGRTALAREFGVRAFQDNAQAVADAAAVVLAVKPQNAGAVLTALAPALAQRRPLVLSIMAGIRVHTLQGWCGANVPVVRAMPNRPALVGAGVTGLFAPDPVGAAHRTLANDLMDAVGAVVWVESEDALDIVTALSGSGPAYCFLLAESMMQAAIDLGLQPAVARTLAIETLHGAGRMAHADAADLARLRAEVTSPGGTTEAALKVFEAADLRGIVARAITAATHRSIELATRSGNPPA